MLSFNVSGNPQIELRFLFFVIYHQDAYPQVYQFSTSIFPSVDDDVVTSPYNRYEINITSAYADVL
jgi:hypothetical protein